MQSIVLSVANDVFDQDWVIEGDLDEDTVSSESESEEEVEKAPPSDVEGSSTVKVKKCCKKIKDKTNLFPSRRSLISGLQMPHI